MRNFGNAYIGYLVLFVIIGFVLSSEYFATQAYNAKKKAEENATISAFLAGKTLNCIDADREDDISLSKGWQCRNENGIARFKKDGTIFQVNQCRVIEK